MKNWVIIVLLYICDHVYFLQNVRHSHPRQASLSAQVCLLRRPSFVRPCAGMQACGLANISDYRDARFYLCKECNLNH